MPNAVEQRNGFISLDAARQLDRFRIDGDPIDLTTIHRWCRRGVRGVRLRSAVIGGRRVTTEEWVETFIGQLADGEGWETAEHRTPHRREKQITSAELETADID